MTSPGLGSSDLPCPNCQSPYAEGFQLGTASLLLGPLATLRFCFVVAKATQLRVWVALAALMLLE